MKPIYTEKIKIQGEYHEVEGFTPDERFLVLADGTRYRFELRKPNEVDLSKARLLEVARLRLGKGHIWRINGQALDDWLRGEDERRHQLGDDYWKQYGQDYHRRCQLWRQLKAVSDKSEKNSISAVAWFLPEDPAMIAAAQSGSRGWSVREPAGETACMLRVFHRQEAESERGQRPYSVAQAEHGGKHFLSFCWSNGKCIEIKLPGWHAMIAWRSLFQNPGKWFPIPDLMQQVVTPLSEEKGGRFDPCGMADDAVGAKPSAKHARMSKSKIEKELHRIEEEKKAFSYLSISAREECAEYQKLENREESLAEQLKNITRHGDVDPHISGANTWGVWKKRLLDAVSKKEKELAAHLKGSIQTESGSVRFASEILRWVD